MWVVVVLILLFSNTVEASLCVEDNVTKCAELGFTQSSCPYGGVACYYDSTLWHCAKWTCADGRYYATSDKPNGAKCIEVSYKGLDCFDCYSECPVGMVDFATCWGGSLYQIINDATYCTSLGYIDNLGSCTDYLVCPADRNKIRCFN